MQKLIAGVLSLALVLNLGGGIRKNESAVRQKNTRSSQQTVSARARQAYDSILEPYLGATAYSCITDIDGDGIPELILIADKAVRIKQDGATFDTRRFVYSVYTYGNSGAVTLINERVTPMSPASGCAIMIGVDRVDGKPMLVAKYESGPTGVYFGDDGYELEIDVQAIDPFSDVVLSELHQEIRGSTIVAESPKDFSREVRRYSQMKLDANGVLSFSPAVHTQPTWQIDPPAGYSSQNSMPVAGTLQPHPTGVTFSQLRYTVFDSGVNRDEVKTITFKGSKDLAPLFAWDVSDECDGSVVAWVEGDSGDYDLYIAANGRIRVTSCSELFAFYFNVESISFGGVLDTSEATDMFRMFQYCNCLTSLDLSSFDTSRVTDMEAMFESCSALSDLDVSGFDTSKVTNMVGMFRGCQSLTDLDLSSFDFSHVQYYGDFMDEGMTVNGRPWERLFR